MTQMNSNESFVLLLIAELFCPPYIQSEMVTLSTVFQSHGFEAQSVIVYWLTKGVPISCRVPENQEMKIRYPKSKDCSFDVRNEDRYHLPCKHTSHLLQ